MSTASRPYNFSAGPAILPAEVFQRASEAVVELRQNGHERDAAGTGLSLLEISHRSKEFGAVHEAAVALAHEVLRIPADTHKILLLPGGATQQFAMVPQNLRRDGRPMVYVDTGAWAGKAIAEARIQGPTEVLASSKDVSYTKVPEFDPSAAEGASYLHLTTNETIGGIEYSSIPEVDGVPVVIDASSHIGSRPMDLHRAGLGYAGTQKNLGCSGLCLVWIRHDLLELEPVAPIAKFFRYQSHAKADSLLNTPNTFGILVLKLVLEWLRDQGGVDAMAKRNVAKATRLYEALDASSLFAAMAQPGHRSNMNVTFTLGGAPEADQEAQTKRFLSEAAQAGLVNLKGHRSVGGCRASIYNAFPAEGVDALVEFMRAFEAKA